MKQQTIKLLIFISLLKSGQIGCVNTYNILPNTLTIFQS